MEGSNGLCDVGPRMSQQHSQYFLKTKRVRSPYSPVLISCNADARVMVKEELHGLHLTALDGVEEGLALVPTGIAAFVGEQALHNVQLGEEGGFAEGLADLGVAEIEAAEGLFDLGEIAVSTGFHQIHKDSRFPALIGLHAAAGRELKVIKGILLGDGLQPGSEDGGGGKGEKQVHQVHNRLLAQKSKTQKRRGGNLQSV